MVALVAAACTDRNQPPPTQNEHTRGGPSGPPETFEAAKLPAEIEVYAGAAHGWCPPDSGVYNEAQAEKAWARLLVLYGRALACVMGQ